MTRSGLTITMIFLAESANYGEGVGNISTLKKMSRGNYEQYTYISRQAMRYNIMQQACWDNTPVDGKSGVVQFAPSATIQDYPEIDLFGYMKTSSKEEGKSDKGGASTRSAVVRLSNAIALEPYQSDLEFLTNMGLAKRQNLENGIAQSEIHRAFYTYTVTVDLDRVGIDGELSIPKADRAQRMKVFLDTIQFLYRDIKGRRENLSPIFVIGGRYERKNPFFENRLVLDKGAIRVNTLTEILESTSDIRENTSVGVMSGIFANDSELKQILKAGSVADTFNQLKKEMDNYYGESN
ncbi:MAG: type I-B CRISPR-associated protein Cas7/Cst2/DevR [Lachnospiraceae bacterium]|nr:type I-B CRISPR-associated protein Cas7/Cst2/DevR [Lachnospiraceae bacterium]